MIEILPFHGNEVKFICPNCGSKDIIIEEEENGFYHLYTCKLCGYKNQKKK